MLTLLLLMAAATPLMAQGQGRDSTRTEQAPTTTTHPPGNADRPWQDYFDDMGLADDAASEQWASAYELLDDLAANPMDINSCTRQDLERLPFLSAQQVMGIMDYRDRHGRIETPTELMMIPQMDWRARGLLTHFIRITPRSDRPRAPSMRTLASLLRRGSSELTGDISLPLYTRAGDRNGYLGPRYKHWLRYTFTSGPRLRMGFTAAQDAGEPFFAGRNATGYDFYSAYLLVRGMGRLRTAVVGRYRLRMGMGLVVNNSFSMGKLATLQSMGRSITTITGHTGRSDGNYLQGAAATIAVTRWMDATAFASWRRIDATLNTDTNTIKTLSTSGLHRTPKEMARRGNAAQTVAGGNVNVRLGRWHAGITAVYTAYNRPLAPNKTGDFNIYKRWAPEGKQFWNASVDYGYESRRLTLAGETATGDCHSIATLNTVSWMPAERLSIVALQRFYAYQYNSLLSSAFAEGGHVQNESGLYLGVTWSPMRGLSLRAYTDYAYFAWARYNIMGGSHSWDNLVAASLQRGSWTVSARYRLRLRQRDDDDRIVLINVTEQRARLTIGHTTRQWTVRAQGDFADIYSPYFIKNVDLRDKRKRYQGWMASLIGGWRCSRIGVNAMAGYFHTDNYEARVYAYEPRLLYTFSYPMYHGHGLHWSANVRAHVTPRLMLLLRASSTRYFDQKTISSGLQEIDGPVKTDIEAQARWKF